MEFAAFLIGLIILIYGVEKITMTIFGGEKKKISETAGKNIDRWGRGIILFIFLSILWFVITIDSEILIKFYLISYLTSSLGFQAIMEFIFLKETKQYISTTIVLILGLIVMYNLDHFPFLDQIF